MSNDVVLTAGTIFSVEFDPDSGADNFVHVPGLLSVGETGDTSEAKDKTALEDTSKQFGTSMFEGPEKSLKGQFRSHVSAVKSLKQAAVARKSLRCRIEWPDGPNGTTEGGTSATFQLQMLGFKMDDTTNEDWLVYTIPSKQSGKTTWTDPTGS